MIEILNWASQNVGLTVFFTIVGLFIFLCTIDGFCNGKK